jgi:hypothetical protein
MAKRSRGHVSRPGQRAPLQRQAARPATPPPAGTVVTRPAGLTDEEEARAAQLEAAIVAEERKTDAATQAARSPRPEPARSSTLEISAAEEYAYVARDVRRIAIVGGGLIAFLIALWLISHLVGIGPL